MTLLGLVGTGYLVALLAPFLARLARRRTAWLLALYPAVCCAILGASSTRVVGGETLRESLAWVPSLDVFLSLRLDGLSLLFALLICGLGALVLLYAGDYFGDEASVGRFYAILLVFMASMLGLVLSDNVLALFLFWEGTSISSYLLIGWKHSDEQARKSALQALLITGGGGLALLAGFVMMRLASGSWELSQMGALQNHPFYLAIILMVFLGAFTKSAQWPFHFWLPGAMAAPTPVSAYLHSATMVKAGLYLLARLSPTLGGTSQWSNVLLFFGGATMLAGGVLALWQTDLKKLLAYSTIAALGTLVLLLGIGTPLAFKAFAVFLLAHAAYKGALFMVAGALDHETGTRDVRRLGGLRILMPRTFWAATLAGVALAGVAPTLAFVGKETLFDAALRANEYSILLVGVSLFAGIVFSFVALCASVEPFWGKLRREELPQTPHEALLGLWLGPLVLAASGVVLGLLVSFLNGFIAPVVAAVAGREEAVKLALWHGFNVPLLLSVVSLVGGVLLYLLREKLRSFATSSTRWDWGPAQWGRITFAGLNGVARLQTRVLQSGYLRAYVITIVVTTVALVGYTLVTREGLPPDLWLPPAQSDIRFYEAVLVMLLVAAGITAMRSDSRLSSLAALGVLGYGVSLTYLLFGAPDLAMTQVLVDTLAVILFVLVFYHLPRFARISSLWVRLRDFSIALSGGLLMTTLILVTNRITLHPHISDYFLENSLPKGYGRNVVNVILVDFRALDTLGEITVLALAGVGVYALLKLRPRERAADFLPPHIVQDAPQSGLGDAIKGASENQIVVESIKERA